MKIAFVIKTLSYAKGGAERVLSELASALAVRGHDIAIYTFDDKAAEPFYPLSQSVALHKLSIGHVASKSGLKESCKRVKALRKALSDHNPEVVVPFMHSMIVPVTLSVLGTGIPVVASEHIVPAHYKDKRFEFTLFALCSFFVDKITVLSDSVKSAYPGFMRKKMIAIPNAITPVTQFADPVADNVKTRIILNVGRLSPQKDQETLIRAFSLIAKKYESWNLHIVGDGRLKKKLEDLTGALNLQKRVIFQGTIKNIESAYQGAQIFALSSLYESFGLATAEAMSHKLPVIGFADCPGTNEIIKNGTNGILVEGSNRIKGFANALATLIENPDLRKEYGLNGFESVKKFEPSAIIATWETLLESYAKIPSRR